MNDNETWTICSDCGIGPGEEHTKECPRNPYKGSKYRAKHIQDPRFKDGKYIGDDK